MSRPSVVVFDVNETLSDVAALGERFAEVGAPAALAPLWFSSVLRDGFALTAAGSTAPFAEIGAELLRTLLPTAGVTTGLDEAVDVVLSGFAGLPLHPDVVPAVRMLHAKGLRLVTLSNGATSVAESLLTTAGVRELFEQLLSVEDAGAWKPSEDAYAFAGDRCGVSREEMVLVAVHPWDIDGAARAGLQTAWVNREGRRYPSYMSSPTLTVSSLEELVVDLDG